MEHKSFETNRIEPKTDKADSPEMGGKSAVSNLWEMFVLENKLEKKMKQKKASPPRLPINSLEVIIINHRDTHTYTLCVCGHRHLPISWESAGESASASLYIYHPSIRGMRPLIAAWQVQSAPASYAN